MEEILSKIKPSAKEKQNFNRTTKEFLSKLKVKDAKAILGGSGAKGTWLSGNHDVDIFVLFDYSKFKSKSAELSDILEPKLKKAFGKVKRLHGSRDYFQISFERIIFEVVPILKISRSEQAVNITDISPLHAKWVNKKVLRKEEVLLAKQFFRANRLYGAESHITGFSGYVLEILIAKYGTFEKLLKAAINWKMKEVIDTEKYYRGKNVLFELNKSKTTSPLIVIDPVDKSRNAAAALSNEKFSLLKKLAKQYLKKPNSSFFEKREVDHKDLLKATDMKKQNLVFLSIKPLAGKNDVVGTKLLKAFEFMKGKLEVFGIVKADWDFDYMYFISKKKELPKTELRMGPPTKMKEHVKAFKKEHKKTSIKNNRVVAEVKIKNPKLNDFVKNLVNEKYVKERVKKIETKS